MQPTTSSVPDKEESQGVGRTTWRAGKPPGSVVADFPAGHTPNALDAYFGGAVIAESVPAENRPLIIAAPDLLETAIRVRDRLTVLLPLAMPAELVAELDAVIAKAKGAQPRG